MGFSITLQPGNHTFIAEAGETILEAATKHGHKLPRGCGDGVVIWGQHRNTFHDTSPASPGFFFSVY